MQHPEEERAGGGPPPVITEEMLAIGPEADGRREFEKGISYFPPVAVALIVVNTAVFVWEVLTGALASNESIIGAGALSRAEVLDGELWRLLSATVLHGGPEHLLGNLAALYVLGVAAEHAFGHAGFMRLYLAAGLCGSALSLLAQPGPSVGASGAIFGLMGAVVVFLHRHRNPYYLRDKRIGGVIAVWAAAQLLIGFAMPFVDNFAHLGGLAGGAAAALLIRPTAAAAAVGSTLREAGAA